MGLNVIMMGPPGAGKGTQAGRFARERGLPKISTGDILREAIKEQNPVALEAKARMDRGELVDDATIIAIVRERLAQAGRAAGVRARRVSAHGGAGAGARRADGRARRRAADRGRRGGAGAGAGAAAGEPADLRDVRDQRRPLGDDGVCGKCGGELVQRADDDQEVVLERLKVYQQATKPVLEYYRERPTFRVVNGAQAPERVAHEVDAMIDDAAAARRSR